MRYNAFVGSWADYQLVMDGNTTTWSHVTRGWRSNKSSIRTEMFLKQRVLDVSEDRITLSTKIDSGAIETNGHPVNGNIGQDVVTVMKPDGRVLSNSGFQGLDLKSMQLVFPDRPLQVGDHWKSDIPESSNVPVPLIVVYEVLGMEAHDGARCVRIRSTVRSNGPKSAHGVVVDIRADGDILFDVDNGMMLSNDVSSRMVMHQNLPPGGAVTPTITQMNMTMKMARVKSGSQ